MIEYTQQVFTTNSYSNTYGSGWIYPSSSNIVKPVSIKYIDYLRKQDE